MAHIHHCKRECNRCKIIIWQSLQEPKSIKTECATCKRFLCWECFFYCPYCKPCEQLEPPRKVEQQRRRAYALNKLKSTDEKQRAHVYNIYNSTR